VIPVQGLSGARVAVLGLGRSGLTAAHALAAGGALPLCWDDNGDARTRAEEAGFTCIDLNKSQSFQDVDRLIVSPGIPHLYPAPNPVVAHALAAGVPVDNDIGLFFQSFATRDWDSFDVAPRVVAVTGSNGKSTTSALIHHVLQHVGRPAQLAGNIGRGVLDWTVITAWAGISRPKDGSLPKAGRTAPSSVWTRTRGSSSPDS